MAVSGKPHAVTAVLRRHYETRWAPGPVCCTIWERERESSFPSAGFGTMGSRSVAAIPTELFGL